MQGLETLQLLGCDRLGLWCDCRKGHLHLHAGVFLFFTMCLLSAQHSAAQGSSQLCCLIAGLGQHAGQAGVVGCMHFKCWQADCCLGRNSGSTLGSDAVSVPLYVHCFAMCLIRLGL